MNGHFVVFLNGDMNTPTFYKKWLDGASKFIAVDGGIRHLQTLGKTPDVVIGDFDSFHDGNKLEKIYPKAQIIRFPAKKNYTDGELAIEWALDNGAKKLTFIGGIGNRMDHTLSTIFLLKKCLDASVCACMVNERNCIWMTNKEIEIPGRKGELLSLVPITDTVEGIDLEGLSYPLENATLKLGSSTGISNVFEGSRAKVSLKKGILLVFKSQDMPF